MEVNMDVASVADYDWPQATCPQTWTLQVPVTGSAQDVVRIALRHHPARGLRAFMNTAKLRHVLSYLRQAKTLTAPGEEIPPERRMRDLMDGTAPTVALDVHQLTMTNTLHFALVMPSWNQGHAGLSETSNEGQRTDYSPGPTASTPAVAALAELPASLDCGRINCRFQELEREPDREHGPPWFTAVTMVASGRGQGFKRAPVKMGDVYGAQTYQEIPETRVLRLGIRLAGPITIRQLLEQLTRTCLDPGNTAQLDLGKIRCVVGVLNHETSLHHNPVLHAHTHGSFEQPGAPNTTERTIEHTS